MKKSLIIVALIFALAVTANAGEESLQAQKDEIWSMAKLYKQDNTKRSFRLPAAPKAKIGRPVYRPKTKRAGNATAANIAPVAQVQSRILNFSTTTAWGTYKVTVIDPQDKPYFDVTFESQQPVQEIVIRDTEKKIDAYNCSLPDIKIPDAPIRINYAYKPLYLLILKANIDGEIQPQIIPLYKKNMTKTAQ
jgi:hypothetical protein